MPSALLGIARGALKGDLTARKENEERADRELQKLLALSQIEGVSIGDDGPPPATAPTLAPPPVVAPPIPGAPPPPIDSSIEGAPSGSPFEAAHEALTPPPAADVPRGNIPAPAPAATPPATPSSVIRIGTSMIGGAKRGINLDLSQTAGARKTAADKSNKAAHAELEGMGSDVGAYDPSVDYVAERKKYRDRKLVADALVKTGKFTKEEAEVYARTGEDLPARGRKTALEEANIERAKRERRGPVPGTPEYYAMVGTIADIRKSHGAGAAAADPVKQKEKWVRTRMVQLMKSPGKDPDLGTALPGLTKEEAIAQAGDEWDSVVGADAGGDEPSSESAPPSSSGGGPLANKGKPAIDQKGMQRELDQAAADYKELLAVKGIDKAAAKKAYDDTVTSISRKYGAIK